MNKPEINIQDGYLFQSLKSGQPLTLELVNGRRIEGVLKRFDRFALVIEQDQGEKLVYKHGIATIEVVPV
jgi:RNA chaperone Hfq